MRTVYILMAANLMLFVAVSIGVMAAGDKAALWFALPASAAELLCRPWTVISYMFTQWNVVHLLVNMLWLWCWVRVSCLTPGCCGLTTGARLIGAYLTGGILGAIIYEIASATGVDCGWCLTGSSAAVVGVITAGAVNSGRVRVNLVFFGRVRLLWAAVVAVGLCLLGDLGGDPGTGLAHLGGVIGGVLFGFWQKHWTASEAVRAARGLGNSGDDSRDLDTILAKVGRSGYGSLNTIERNRLFEISKRMK